MYKWKKNIFILWGVIILTSFSVKAGSYFEFVKPEISFRTIEDLSTGITVTVINSGCCTGDLKWLDFTEADTKYKISGISIPLTVESNKTFEFKVLIKNPNTNPDLNDEILKLYSEYNESFLVIKYEAPTKIQIHNSRNENPFVLNLFTGSLVFSLENSSSVSAELFSLLGKKVDILFSNKILHKGNTTISTNTFKQLSQGIYLLQCNIHDWNGLKVVQQRVVITK